MSVKTAEKLKSLETQRASLEQNILDQIKIINAMDTKLVHMRRRFEDIGKAILTIKNQDVIITEHAMLRFIERVENVDMNDIRNKILPENVKEQIEALGDGKYPVDGFNIIVKGSSVVTVVYE